MGGSRAPQRLRAADHADVPVSLQDEYSTRVAGGTAGPQRLLWLGVDGEVAVVLERQVHVLTELLGLTPDAIEDLFATGAAAGAAREVVR